MKLSILIRKLALEKNDYISSETLKEYCKDIKTSYLTTVKYLLRHNYIVRILKGIFYVKSLEERKFKKININYLDAVKKALEIKKIENWYFGLETALKLNKVTHEYFTLDYVFTDSLFRPKPVTIMNHKIKFIKVNARLFRFGIIKNSLNYSNIEKTILDFIYIGKYNSLSDNEIKNNIVDLLKLSSKRKLKIYLKYYPKTVTKLLKGII